MERLTVASRYKFNEPGSGKITEYKIVVNIAFTVEHS